MHGTGADRADVQTGDGAAVDPGVRPAVAARDKPELLRVAQDGRILGNSF